MRRCAIQRWPHAETTTSAICTPWRFKLGEDNVSCDTSNWKAATRAVRAGIATDSAHGAVVPPLYLSTNFSFAGLGEKRPYDYTRSGNPTRDQLGQVLAELEAGAGAVVTSSGMAALTLITHLLPASARLIAPHDCYGGSFRLLSALARDGRLQVDFVDQSDPQALAQAFATPVAMVLVETASNPLLRVVDIASIASLCQAHGALLAVDNTFLSPALHYPAQLHVPGLVLGSSKNQGAIDS